MSSSIGGGTCSPTMSREAKLQLRQQRKADRESFKGMKHFFGLHTQNSPGQQAQFESFVVEGGRANNNSSNTERTAAVRTNYEVQNENATLSEAQIDDIEASIRSNPQLIGANDDKSDLDMSKRSSNEELLMADIRKRKNRARSGSTTVYAVLMLASIAFGVSTYFLLTAAKENEFQSEVSRLL